MPVGVSSNLFVPLAWINRYLRSVSSDCAPNLAVDNLTTLLTVLMYTVYIYIRGSYYNRLYEYILMVIRNINILLICCFIILLSLHSYTFYQSVKVRSMLRVSFFCMSCWWNVGKVSWNNRHCSSCVPLPTYFLETRYI